MYYSFCEVCEVQRHWLALASVNQLKTVDFLQQLLSLLG